MLKPLIKYTFLAFLWKKYRRVIISSILLLFAILIVHIVHNDYVNYSEKVGEKDGLKTSFLFKWCLILFAIVAYFVYVKVVLRVKHKPKEPSAGSEPGVSQEHTDAFAAIRKKSKLRSKADRIINK